MIFFGIGSYMSGVGEDMCAATAMASSAPPTWLRLADVADASALCAAVAAAAARDAAADFDGEIGGW
jgi:hypothetical protein